MRLSLFAALLASAAAAAPACAQDNQQDDGPNFTGVRFEARAGADRFGGRVTMPDPDDADETITVSGNQGKAGYGAELGYDYQLGPVVIGVYAGVDNSGTHRCFEVVGDDLGCLDSGRNLYAGGRAGVVIWNNLLVYGRGGISRGRYSLSYAPDEDKQSSYYVIADSAGGTHYGGGVEMAFTPNFYGRVEYVRTRYDRTDWVNPANDDMTASIRARRSQVFAAIGLRF